MLKINKDFKGVSDISEYMNAETLMLFRFDNRGNASLEIEIIHVTKFEKVRNNKYLICGDTIVGTHTHSFRTTVEYSDNVLIGAYELGSPPSKICIVLTTINYSEDMYEIFALHKINYFKNYTYNEISSMFGITLDIDWYTKGITYEMDTNNRTFTKIANFINEHK